MRFSEREEALRQVWVSNDECQLEGVRFSVGKSDYSKLKTTADQVWVLKGKTFFDRYDSYLGGDQPKNVLEVGIFEGGSALLFADKWPDAKIVGVDIRDPNPEVTNHIERLGFSDRISLYYNTSQNDEAKLAGILEKEFPNGMDLVIDDASHLYELTKASFDILFPRLTPGGMYIVEDWAWAHWAGTQNNPSWQKHKYALTNLLFEVCMASASTGGLISDIYVNSNFFAVRKAKNCPPLKDFRISERYALRGKEFIKI